MAVYHLTRRQCREIDRIAIEELGLPGMVLMENAARGVFDLLNTIRPTASDDMRQPVTIFCGKGNNGGDGLAVARHIVAAGGDVRVALIDPPARFTGDAATQLNIVTKMGLTIEQIDPEAAFAKSISGVVIDAIYGTGFRSPSRINFRKMNEACASGHATVLSIDVPSGMDADTGETGDGGAVRAAWTVSMKTPKRGFLHEDAEAFTGRVWTVGLGIPWSIVERAAASPP